MEIERKAVPTMVSVDDAKKLALALNGFNAAMNNDKYAPYNLQHKKDIRRYGKELMRAQEATGIVFYSTGAINRVIIIARDEMEDAI